MVDFVEEIVIDRSMDDVFEFLANPVNRIDIYSIVSEVEQLDGGDIQIGTRFREMRQFANRKVGTELEILTNERPNHVSIKSESKGMNVIYRYVLNEAVQGTKVKFEGTVEATTLKTKLMRPVLLKMVRQEDSDHLLYVKKALENN